MKKSEKNSLREVSRFDDPLAGDLSDLMLEADWKVASFELTKPKTETITLRVSKELLKGIKSEAKKRGLDYTKFMRILMENYLRRNKAS
jgi:predicted DNA binding CopG/RHH family protein